MGKGPRRINPVSVILVLIAVAIVYSAVKFIPVYLKRGKVDTILDSARYDAQRFDEYSYSNQEEKVLDKLRDEILDLGGIDDETLDVYFAEDYSRLYVDYTVIVEHPFGKTTEFQFEQSVEIDR
jgi:hypothetical protein